MGVDAKKLYFVLGVVSADGKRLVHKAERSSLCDDLGVTEKYNVIMGMPLTVDINRLARGGPLIKYEKEMYARIGVMPRYGNANSVKWFEVKPNCTFHLINCFEDGVETVTKRRDGGTTGGRGGVQLEGGGVVVANSRCAGAGARVGELRGAAVAADTLHLVHVISKSDLSSSWDMDDEYEKFIRRMNPPRVVIDNEACNNATVIQVDSANKHGILLEVVQVLTDLNLVITKGYISSDGGWFMDVFNVTDRDGKKLQDEATINGIMDFIRKSLGADSSFIPSPRRSVGVAPSTDFTSIELTGTDRPGLLSEVCAVLNSLKCNVVNAEVWTHNTRAAAVMHVTDEASPGLAITDPERISRIKDLLCNVLKGNNKTRGARTAVSLGGTHTERRLHQMMFDDRDYERSDQDHPADEKLRPKVTVVNWYDKDYSVVTIRCKDRPKLLFDTVCTLTDMQYVVFHANVDAEGPEAYQEYYIRHIDGSPVNSEAERQRVIQCLEAAIERRVSEDLKLELCTSDRVGLLSDVTRIFRENSLSVTRAEVTTRGGRAVNIFYVRDAAGNPVDAKTIDAVRRAIGLTVLHVKGNTEQLKSSSPPQESPTWFLFGGLFKSKSVCNFGSIRPYSS